MKKNSFTNTVRKISILTLSFFLLMSFSIFSNEDIVIKANEDQNVSLLMHNNNFTVRKINTVNGTFSDSIQSFTDFKFAKEKMLELSKDTPHVVTIQVVDARDASNGDIPAKDRKFHTKIIAQPEKGFAQSYPYRVGSVKNAAVNAAKSTLDIYSDSTLKNNIGYFPAHYQMQVYDVVEVGGSFSALIEISGQTGYVDINKIDLIPLFYIKNGVPLNLGGNESFYPKPEVAYSKIVEAETYTVKNVGSYREITFNSKRTTPKNNASSTTYGLTPAWLVAGVYYSNDGVHFYKDIEKNIKVMDGTAHGEFYAYFQWLPVNTISLHSGDALSELLKSYNYTNSVYYDQSQSFVENGNKYGMNSLLIFAQASLESAYGRSDFSTLRNNLFGWGAADSNPSNAHYFNSVSDSINLHMSQNLREYMNPNHWKHYGFSFGNMSSGVSYKYASDPLYGIKVAGLAFTVDKRNGFKDYDNYQLMKINNGQRNSFLSAPGPGSTVYSNKNLPNQIVASLGTSGNYTKTHLTVPTNGGKSPLNLLKDHAYIATSALSPIKKSGPAASALPTSLITVNDSIKKFTFNSAQSLRTEWNENSRVLSTIPKGVQLSGKETTNGYVQIEYGDHIGYVHKKHLTEGDLMPTVNQSGDYKVKSDPYGTLSLRETASTSSVKLGNIPNGTNLKAVDDGKMPWLKTTYDGKTGYVHSDYLELIILESNKPVEPTKPVEPPKPTYPKGDVNGDGKVSLGDLALTKSHLLGNRNLNKEEIIRADVNLDGKISLGDLGMLKAHLLGNIILE